MGGVILVRGLLGFGRGVEEAYWDG